MLIDNPLEKSTRKPRLIETSSHGIPLRRPSVFPRDEIVNAAVVRSLSRQPWPSEFADRAKMVFAMDRVPSQPVKDLPNLVRVGAFSLDRLLSHIDPGTAEESEDFVRLIYEQRHIDLSSDRNGKTGR